MTEVLNEPLKEPRKVEGNPFEFARVLCAFVDCSTPIQNIVLEMAAIISDPDSDDDDRMVAFDAMMEALFPGNTADAREQYHAFCDPRQVPRRLADCARNRKALPCECAS